MTQQTNNGTKMPEDPIEQITEIATVTAGFLTWQRYSATEGLYTFDCVTNAENFQAEIDQNKPDFRSTIENALDIDTALLGEAVNVRIRLVSFS